MDKHYNSEKLLAKRLPLLFLLIVTLFILILSSLKEAIAQEWRPISPLPTFQTINDTEYGTGGTAFAVGSGGTFLVTEDDGVNWVVASNPSDFGSLSVLQVEFVDNNNGYVTLRGGDGILKTNSGGEGTWFDANGNDQGISGPTTTTQALDLQVLDINTVFTTSRVRAYTTTDGGTIWTEITPPGLGSSPNFRDIHFLDANTGFILTRSQGLYKTVDGGSNWTQLTAFTGTQASKVHFEDANNGWIVEGTNSATNFVHRTTDGGTSWSSTTYTGTGDFGQQLEITSLTEGKIFDSNKVYTTSDGGATWSLEHTLPFSPIGVDQSSGNYLLGGADGVLGQYSNSSFVNFSNSLTGNKTIQDVYFHNVDNGFVLTANGDVYRTADAGISWIHLGLGGYSDIDFANGAVGFLVGNAKKVLKSMDSGVNWTEVAELGAGSFIVNSVDLLDANTGWVVGSSSKIFKTIDGGASWVEQIAPVGGLSLYKVFFLDANTGYISASAGNVFKTIDGGSNWTSLSFPGSNNAFDMHWKDVSTGWVVERDIWKTTDGGTTWSGDGFGPVGSLSEIDFIDDNNGFATFQGGAIYKTTNAGDLWEIFVAGGTLGSSITEIHAIDANNIWAAGPKTLFNYTNLNLGPPTTIGLFLPDTDFCPDEEFVATFVADGQFDDEQVDLQLSDANGSFSSPTVIGSYPEAGFFLGSILGTIPGGIAPSSNYRMRAVSSSLNGNDNGYNLSVGGPPSPTVFAISTSDVCKNTFDVVYEIEAVPGMSYLWSYSGSGTNITGNGTNSVEVDFFNSATSGTLSVVLSNSCGSGDPLDLAITVGTPGQGGSATGGTTICSGGTVPELTVSGHIGNVLRWEKAVSPFSSYTPIASSASASFIPPGSPTETTRYRAVVQSGGCAEAASNFTTVNVSSESVGGSISGTTEIEPGNSPGVLSLTGQTGNVVRWEKAEAPFSSFTPIVHSLTTYNPGVLTNDTQFRAVVQNSPCDEVLSLAIQVNMLPVVDMLSPEDNATDVSINATLTVTFSEDIQKGAGSISVSRVSNGQVVFGSIIGNSVFTVTGNTLSFSPLDGNTGYQNDEFSVTITDGAIQDLLGNNFQGLSGDDWTFTTEDLNPYVNSLSPTDGSNVPVDQVFTVEFTRDVVKGTGVINFNRQSDDVNELQISVVSDEVTILGNIVTIDPDTDLPGGKDLYIQTFTTTFESVEGVAAEQIVKGDWDISTNKLDQTITFGPLANATYGDSDSPLTASASSGLTVSYLSSDPLTASISGSNISIHKAGSVTITASQSGDSEYNAAPDVMQGLIINLASLDVIADDKTKTFNDPLPALTFTYSGFTNGDDQSDLNSEPSISTSAMQGSDAGTYDITLTGGSDDNYTLNLQNGELTIDPADQTVTIDPISDKLTTDGSFDVVASTNSGLILEYAIESGPATISGSTVTLTGQTGTVIVAVNQAGNQNYNPAVEATVTFNVTDPSKLDQTISFTAIPNGTFGDGPITLSATASSGLPVTFTIISGPGTLSENALNISGAGTVEVAANQAGDGTYNPAQEQTQSVSIGKADQSITIDPISTKLTTDSPFDVVAIASSGLGIEFTVTGPATIVGNTISLDGGVGTVVVTASQAGNENYNPISADISFLVEAEDEEEEVTKQDQTISFPVIPNATFGDDPFELTASASSGLSIDFTVISGPIAISGTTVTITGAGEVTIRADQAGDDDYNPAPSVEQTFNVSKANQTITVETIADLFIDANPFEVIASVTSGLSVEFAITGPASISGTEVTLDGNPGTVTITITQAGDSNYEEVSTSISFEVLEIAKQDQTITIDAISDKIFGDAPFDISANSNSGLEITFTVVSGPISITGTEVTILGAGLASIAADQSGNDDYNAADQVVQNFEIQKADQEITVAQIDDKLNTSDPFEIVASSTSNLELSYNVDGPASITGTIVTLDGDPGIVTITVSQSGDANYNAAEDISISFEVIEDIPLSIDRDLSSVSVYPNPTSDYLIIEGEVFNKIRIFDTKGSILYQDELNGERIDVRSFEDGVLLIELSNENRILRQRILKKS